MFNLYKYIELYEINEKQEVTENYIKNKYRELAKKYHPDVTNYDSSVFAEINNAKEYLLNNYELINIAIKIKNTIESKFVFDTLNLVDFSLKALNDDQISFISNVKKRIDRSVNSLFKFKTEKFILTLGLINRSYSENEDIYINLVLYIVKTYVFIINFNNIDYDFIENIKDNKNYLNVSDDTILYLILKIYILTIFELISHESLNKNSLIKAYDILSEFYELTLLDNYRTSEHYLRFMKRKIEEELKKG